MTLITEEKKNFRKSVNGMMDIGLVIPKSLTHGL